MFRRSPRALLLWTGAIVLALVTALVVGTDLATLHRRAGDLGPEVVAAVAARDLPVGVTLERNDLRARRVHRSQLPPGALTPDDAAGRVVAVAVLRDGFVVERNVAPRDRTGLDAVIPAEMRVVRIVVPQPTDELHVESSHVDVLATFDAGAVVDSEGEESGDPTVVVARGALVVGTDDGDVGLGPAGAGGNGVALLVTEDEARAVAYASAAGIVSIALVPPEDARARIST
jgi:Flp pilus assembly protein CpaB